MHAPRPKVDRKRKLINQNREEGGVMKGEAVWFEMDFWSTGMQRESKRTLNERLLIGKRKNVLSNDCSTFGRQGKRHRNQGPRSVPESTTWQSCPLEPRSARSGYWLTAWWLTFSDKK